VQEQEAEAKKLVFAKAKHKDWLSQYTEATCKLNRHSYCQFISDYITGERDGFVLNLNGSWGTGKTHFLRMLYSNLLRERHPVIYIDAWESDFSKDPLTVITSELISQLNNLNADIGKEIGPLRHYLGKALKGTIYGAAGYVSKKAFDDSAVLIESMKTLLEGEKPEDFLQSLQYNYCEQIGAINSIRIELSNLAEVLETVYEAKLPVIVLVDELDRCRPTYAVELLEVIKHFFQTKNLVFVIASDTDQLKHSIKTVYGQDFDSDRYLKRFFDREARLPTPNLQEYISLLELNLDSYQSENLIMAPGSISENPVYYVSAILRSFKMEIRDIDQITSKLVSCLRTLKNSANDSPLKQQIDLPMLTLAIIEQHLNLESYHNRSNTNKVIPSSIDPLPIFNRFDTKKMLDLSIDFSTDHGADRWGIVTSNVGDAASGSYSSQEERYVAGYRSSCMKLAPAAETKTWLWEDYKRIVDLAGNIA